MTTTSIKACSCAYMQSSSEAGGLYSDANQTGGNSGASNNKVVIDSNLYVGQSNYASAYYIYQTLLCFDLTDLPPCEIDVITLSIYTQTKNADVAYTINAKEHSAWNAVACTTGEECSPMEYFYKGSDIVSYTGNLIAAALSGVANTKNTFSSVGAFKSTIKPGNKYYISLTNSLNAAETPPTFKELGHFGFHGLLTEAYKPVIDITHTPFFQNELGFNF